MKQKPKKRKERHSCSGLRRQRFISWPDQCGDKQRGAISVCLTGLRESDVPVAIDRKHTLAARTLPRAVNGAFVPPSQIADGRHVGHRAEFVRGPLFLFCFYHITTTHASKCVRVVCYSRHYSTSQNGTEHWLCGSKRTPRESGE